MEGISLDYNFIGLQSQDLLKCYKISAWFSSLGLLMRWRLYCLLSEQQANQNIAKLSRLKILDGAHPPCKRLIGNLKDWLEYAAWSSEKALQKYYKNVHCYNRLSVHTQGEVILVCLYFVELNPILWLFMWQGIPGIQWIFLSSEQAQDCKANVTAFATVLSFQNITSCVAKIVRT